MPKILGIQFNDSPADTLVDQALSGGLSIFPSGPGLAIDLIENPTYRQAVTEADLAVTDSGAMVLFLKLFHRRTILRTSGLHFLQRLLERDELKARAHTFWVHPSEEQRGRSCAWLGEQGFALSPDSHYIAPHYKQGDIVDEALFEVLSERKPKVIIICIGGGVQEILGHWIREKYKARGEECPAIICTGAAIAFMCGSQVNIPTWADRLFLGWLFRCIYEPKKFIPRYWNSLSLAFLVARHNEELPPIKIRKKRPH